MVGRLPSAFRFFLFVALVTPARGLDALREQFLQWSLEGRTGNAALSVLKRFEIAPVYKPGAGDAPTAHWLADFNILLQGCEDHEEAVLAQGECIKIVSEVLERLNIRFEIRVEPSFTYKEPPRPLKLLHELDVAPGEQRALPSDLDPAHDLHCRIYLKGYFWSSPVALPVRRQDAEGEEAIGEVWLDREEGGGEKVRLRLLSGGVAGARNVRVVGALALHNHSGVPLEATDSSEKGGSAYWQSVPPLFSKDSPDVGVFASAVEEPLSPTAVKNLGKIGTPEIAASHMRHSLIDALDEPSPITPLRALKSVPESCWPVLFEPNDSHDSRAIFETKIRSKKKRNFSGKNAKIM